MSFGESIYFNPVEKWTWNIVLSSVMWLFNEFKEEKRLILPCVAMALKNKYTSSSTSRAAFCCPCYPLWSGPTFWIQGRWVMNCLLVLFVSVCGPDKQFIRPPFSQWDKRWRTGFHEMSWADYQVAPASEFLLWAAELLLVLHERLFLLQVFGWELEWLTPEVAIGVD